MRGQSLNTRWTGCDFDGDNCRARFRQALKRRSADFARGRCAAGEILTPYWSSGFNDWLLYESTIAVCGVVCTERTEDFCTFEADTSGVQTEGICMVATFVIPTAEFTKEQLRGIVPGCGEYHPFRLRRGCDGREAGDYGPFGDGKYVKHLAWWYDGYYDGENEEGD